MKTVLIILAEGFEETEAVVTIGILRRAGCKVLVAALHNKTVISARKIKIQADILLSEVSETVDALVLPGGALGSKNLSQSAAVKMWIERLHHEKKWIAAICAAPAIVLAPTGILDGKKATGYPGTETGFSSTTKIIPEAVVIDEPIITSRGPGSTISFALTLVEKLCGAETSKKIKQDLLF